MSPSADEIVRISGKDLKEKDMLVVEDEVSGQTRDFEIMGFGTKKRGLFRKRDVSTVTVREITKSVPGERIYSVPTDQDVWTDIIRREHRTDLPSLKER